MILEGKKGLGRMVATKSDASSGTVFSSRLLSLPALYKALPSTQQPSRTTRGLGEEKRPHHEGTGLRQPTDKLCLFWGERAQVVINC